MTFQTDQRGYQQGRPRVIRKATQQLRPSYLHIIKSGKECWLRVLH